MSASDKKKLRKEQNAAAMTERQKKAKKEANATKAYTLTFIVVMVLVVAIFLGITLKTPVTGLINRVTTAVTIDGHKLTSVELNYYYMDFIQAYASQYDDYGSYSSTYLMLYTGLNVSTPLDEQVYNTTTGETWADYFATAATENAKWAYAMYDKAVSAGYQLTDSEQKNLDLQEENLELYATYYGYSDAKSYLRGVYGPGATVKSYMEYTRINTIANSFAGDYYDGLEFGDPDYREYEKDKMNDYNSYTFSYYFCTVNDFLKFNGGGTTEKDENGNETTTYTDEQKEQARKDAEAAAKGLAIADNSTLEKLNAAVKALDIHKDKKEEDLEKVAASENTYVLYGALSNTITEEGIKWLSDSARKPGDITSIEVKSGEGENATVNGYYVLLFQEMTTNEKPLANVQHILVKFTGGTKDAETGVTTYSDAEKQATKEKAQAILDEFLKGEKQDSAAFTKLAAQKSEDTGSKDSGGLIEDIYRDSNYVQSFKDWALDDRKVGDTGIIESEYGYHVMFYKEDDELTYRDYMIDIDMTNDAYDEWETAVLDAVTLTAKNLKALDRDLVISG
ncbi:MAG: peptidylprolyl isomerase [Oscillospiraceae bacterium]|nr:peptidylprolyl isomerase [Oscillospiraceae bacterium]